MTPRNEPPSVKSIRALALHALRLRGWVILYVAASTILAVYVIDRADSPAAVKLIPAALLAYLSFIFARPFPAMFRQWRSLGDSHRDLGLTRIHYATIVVEVVMVAVPTIGAVLIIASALRSSG